MRKFMNAIGLWFFAATTLMAQNQDYSKVEIKVTKVAGTGYMLQGAGGHIAASIGQDGIVVVDDQFAPLAAKIEAALRVLPTSRYVSSSTRTTISITQAEMHGFKNRRPSSPTTMCASAWNRVVLRETAALKMCRRRHLEMRFLSSPLITTLRCI